MGTDKRRKLLTHITTDHRVLVEITANITAGNLYSASRAGTHIIRCTQHSLSAAHKFLNILRPLTKHPRMYMTLVLRLTD